MSEEQKLKNIIKGSLLAGGLFIGTTISPKDLTGDYFSLYAQEDTESHSSEDSEGSESSDSAESTEETAKKDEAEGSCGSGGCGSGSCG